MRTWFKNIIIAISIVLASALSLLFVATYFINLDSAKRLEPYVVQYVQQKKDELGQKLKRFGFLESSLNKSDSTQTSLAVKRMAQLDSLTVLLVGHAYGLAERANAMSLSDVDRYSEVNIRLLTEDGAIEKLLLARLVQARDGLLGDIRAFLLSNIFLFLVVVVVSKFTGLPNEYLIVFVSCMLLGTGLGMYLYLFKTHWLYYILSGSYMGYGYLTATLVLVVVLHAFYYYHRLQV
jgi:hypothetical protein